VEHYLENKEMVITRRKDEELRLLRERAYGQAKQWAKETDVLADLEKANRVDEIDEEKAREEAERRQQEEDNYGKSGFHMWQSAGELEAGVNQPLYCVAVDMDFQAMLASTENGGVADQEEPEEEEELGEGNGGDGEGKEEEPKEQGGSPAANARSLRSR